MCPNMSLPRWWSDLPPELLTVVSGRLHAPADFVRFHAVCKPWRESLPPSTALRPVFFPWLLAPPSGRDMNLLCIFSRTSYRAVAPTRFSRHSWVARADGTAAWYFSALPEPRLVDPLTGDEKTLPPFPGSVMMTNSRGVLYSDGTVFLYNFSESEHGDELIDRSEKNEEQVDVESTPFIAAILHPGDAAWKLVKAQLDMCMDEEEFESNHFLATYRVHDGKTLVYLDEGWHLLPPPTGDKCEKISVSASEVLARDWLVESSHVLESRGELLRVSVMIERGGYIDFPSKRGAYQALALAVVVHVMEEEVDAKGRQTVRWARRDDQSFADRVMFLGYPTSFAVEAWRLLGGEDGGCVYFVQRRSEHAELRGVFRYNLLDRKAKFLGRLPPEWNSRRKNEAFLWLLPQPSIAPIQVIRERLEPLKTGDPTRKISTIRIEKQEAKCL